MTQQTNFEAIIVGGSYAGLSAAMALGRSLRNVLIIDSGKPCNRTTPHSHNFITQDGETPQAISQKAKEQVLQYKTVQFLDDLVTDGKKTKNGFEVTTQSGLLFKTKKLIFATGIKDLLPTIEGLSACWGISVIHCPYCHGYEFKNKKTGIMANGEHAFHLAGLVRNLTNDVTIFTQGKPDFTEDQLQKLNNQSVKINENPIQAFVHNEGHIKEVVFTTYAKETFDAVYAAVPFEQHCKVPVSLGCELTETGHIKTDMVQKTTVPGVFACGDNASMMRSVAYAVATGNIAGAMVNKEITEEEFN
ncbi:NAD(P)/FAD-dependent oxidoreductase [Marixanthomonas sp. SCSIO 43207]|uniref:NAD(P)/FAD-dependent oxidoreductase n=1 Tax=Marixanthomonas sp. SCSIO 43207 TaxID=2779360 RepID=UPI001CA88F6C|nr:NAD(P)/FAD-dependent oxidoreductase [Marixanthomonas sp. SCSIO 43207]UAB80008.1 NAD(P)/FAD-dependent oxidoreductase [Marixanthomonas sp. SCSIO 43207]